MRARFSIHFTSGILGLLAVVLVLFPLAGVLSTFRALTPEFASAAIPNIPLIVCSLGDALTIAVFASILAFPVAWFLRSRPCRASLLLLLPLLLPSYLAYAGWGFARAPGTWLGDFLLKGPTGVGASRNWYPTAASNIQAIGGLVLWSWPLAAIVIVSRLRRIDVAVLDALWLETSGPFSRVVQSIMVTRGAILSSIALVMLIMLGSAVPLHVAQRDTYAVHLWRLLDETPHGERIRVWLAAWPTFIVAVIGCIVLMRALDAVDPNDQPDADRPVPLRRSLFGLSSVAIAIGLSVVIPVILFAANLHSLRSLHTFWTLFHGAIMNSAIVSTAVGGTSLLICALAWYAWVSMPRGRPFVVALQAAFLVLGLLPGVLIGAATRQAWDLPDLAWARAIGDSWAVVVLGHLSRFAFLPISAGLLLARTEPRAFVDLRRVDAPPSIGAWVIAAAIPALPIMASIAFATACLSFHEIESSVMLEPPSAAGGSFARVMLQQLHFNRTDELAAGILITVVGSILLGSLATLFAHKRR